ncbi:hypothetical protein SLEP1_g37062 [Rubroshorea leprosula]|uniref:Uncharacterized protein n=1 Tax=Rubroshorea leprosula TaxID=152421 RepID=A0AAV5KU25_9ROSI|nr:hypothetical protein SLEP1_g37062 [Rubroshorea leprosula]
MQFFEYLQGEAESGLERLHQCAEKELQYYLTAEGQSKEFNEFRKKLAGLTSVTRNYFENLVQALETGLSDVDSHGGCNRTDSSKNKGCGSSKGGNVKELTSSDSVSRISTIQATGPVNIAPLQISVQSPPVRCATNPSKSQVLCYSYDGQ